MGLREVEREEGGRNRGGAEGPVVHGEDRWIEIVWYGFDVKMRGWFGFRILVFVGNATSLLS